MPKSTKKSKAKKADFTKPKLKLGKGKQVAANATSTSYKASTLSLANQNLKVKEDKGEPVTRKGLDYGDLVIQLGHYNGHVRKEALAGLKELFNANNHLLPLHTGTTINVLVKLISDTESAVRKALVNFLDWYFAQLERNSVDPFMETLVFFTVSALSNIFLEIRLDALKVLDTLLRYFPQQVVQGWNVATYSEGEESLGSRVMNGLLSFLGVKGGSKTLQLAANVRLQALNTLTRFLKATSSHEDETNFPVWIFRNIFDSQREYQHFFENLHLITSDLSSQEIDMTQPQSFIESQPHLPYDLQADPGPSGLSELSQAAHYFLHELDTTDAHENSFNHSSLLDLLFSILQSVLLESLPLAFNPSLGTDSYTNHLETVLGVMRISNELVTGLEGVESVKHWCQVKSLVEKTLIYFPLSEQNVFDQATVKVLEELDIIFCELVSHLILYQPSVAEMKKGKSAGTLDIESIVEVVKQHILKRLSGTDSSLHQPLGKVFTPQTYNALLPTIWAIISQENTDLTLLDSLFDHFQDLSKNSNLKGPAVTFLICTILISSRPNDFPQLSRLISPPNLQNKILQFDLSLPRLLWELSLKDTTVSTVILRYLHHRRTSKSVPLEDLPNLKRSIQPLYSVKHPKRGIVNGPFDGYEPRMKRLLNGIRNFTEEQAVVSVH